MSFGQQGYTAWSGSGSGGGGGAVVHDNSLFGDGSGGNPLGVEGYYNNTLWVSPNGNDGTAEVGRHTNPFLTIAAAVANANAGDLIYVAAGSYNETGIQKNGVFYYFEMGAVVNSAGKIWDTEFAVANYRVRGYGRFVSSTFPIVSNTDSSVDIECDSLLGQSIAVLVFAGNFRLRARYSQSITQYNMSFRGTSLVDVEVDTIDSGTTTLQSAAIYLLNHSTDLVARTVRITARQILSNGNGSFAAIASNNCPGMTAYINANISHTLTAAQNFLGGIFNMVNNVKAIIFNGNAISTNSYGLNSAMTGGDLLQNFEFQSGKIESLFATVRANGGTLSYFKQYSGAVLKTNGDSPVVELGVGGYFGAKAFCKFESWGLIKNSNAGAAVQSYGIRKEGAASSDTVCRLNGTKIMVPIGMTSIFTGGAGVQDIQVMSAYANQNTTVALINNLIAGTNLIVDANLTDNPVA